MGAKFDTPCSVAVWKDGRIVGGRHLNSRIRVIESDGTTWTLAGTGNAEMPDGSLADAASTGRCRSPSTAARSLSGITTPSRDSRPDISVGGNHIKTAPRLHDGTPHFSAFNRVSGIAFTSSGDLIVADSDNSAVRVIAAQPLAKTAELRDNKMTSRSG